MKKQLIKIPVSAGELVDKITILEIKKKFVSGSGNIEFVEMELKLLNKELDKLTAQNRKLTGILDSHKKSLYNINLKLWKTENELRLFETKKKFEGKFISSARNVYILNDKRAKIKSKINRMLGSEIKEIKQYGNF